MALEQLTERKVAYRSVAPTYILELLAKGQKFVPFQGQIDPNSLPPGYSIMEMQYKGTTFKAIVPQTLLYFMANPGEGNADGALDELAEFYREIEGVENTAIANGETNLQLGKFGQWARESYGTYLINKVIRIRGGQDEEGQPLSELDPKVMERLGLNDPYVLERIKAIAAVRLGKRSDQVQAHDVGALLKHVTLRKDGKTEQLSQPELKRVACYCGSHYELKPEFRNDPDYTYHVSGYHGSRTERKVDLQAFDPKVSQLEKEIADHLKDKNGGKLGPHDAQMLRTVTNLRYIAPENPRAQLSTTPHATPAAENELTIYKVEEGTQKPDEAKKV